MNEGVASSVHQRFMKHSTDAVHASKGIPASELDDTPGVPTSPANIKNRSNEIQSKKSIKQLSRKESQALSSQTREFVPQPQPPCSVRLIDEDERILFDDAETLAWHLGCPTDKPLILIGIVGNTGDGKSHTLNHAFCGGTEVFITSASQLTCTIGVWAAYLPKEGYLLIDTEGLLGASPNPNRQKRLLLKVLALADIFIYRTMSDRLHSDMFTFLADASDAFAKHFSPDLEALAKRTGLPWSSGQLGPVVVIFQETQHTAPLNEPRGLGSGTQSSDQLGSVEPSDDKLTAMSSKFLYDRLSAMKRNINAFSNLIYVGTQTKIPPTDFELLATTVAKLARNTTIRNPRKLKHIFQSLEALNSRFSSELPSYSSTTFVEEYFTCPAKCTSCGARCNLGMNHESGHMVCSSDGEAPPCTYDPGLQNKLYYCMACYISGRRTMMVPKSGESTAGAFSAVVQYIWAGYVLECPRHGIVYRSRAYWSGNVEPEQTQQVHWEVVHVWPGEKSILQGTHPVGQLLLDGLTVVSTQVSQIAGPPARRLGDLIADSVAPNYWQPNSSIKICAVCRVEFPDPVSDDADSTNGRRSSQHPSSHNHHHHHHPHDKPLTELQSTDNQSAPNGKPPNLGALAKVEEGSASSGLGRPDLSSLPKTLVDDISKHHCRACGRGVCAMCSTGRLPVPDQGYGTEAVRVCDQCYESRSKRKSSQNRSKSASVGWQSIPTDGNSNVLRPNGSAMAGRKVVEFLSATAEYISPIYTGPKELVKSLARPDYWQPDESCIACPLCNETFGTRRAIHHCRSCGQGVCAPCSKNRLPVPERGLDFATRVCDHCFEQKLKHPNANLGPSNLHKSPVSAVSQNHHHPRDVPVSGGGGGVGLKGAPPNLQGRPNARSSPQMFNRPDSDQFSDT